MSALILVDRYLSRPLFQINPPPPLIGVWVAVAKAAAGAAVAERRVSSHALMHPDLLGLTLHVSLVRAATSLAFTVSGPPEVNDGCCVFHCGLCKGDDEQ